jgi:hypothetical protein
VSQWGYAKLSFQNNGGCDFSIEALKKKHTNAPGWHKVCEVAQLKRTYQNEISVIFENHQTHVSISQCRACKIEFLTAKSNAGRTDLRCPFGCRAKHGSEGSKRRSKRHYQTEFGRTQKKVLNRKRSKNDLTRPRPRPGRGLTLLYYRWLIWAVERRRFRLTDLTELLAPIFEKVRQHSLEVDDELGNIPDS